MTKIELILTIISSIISFLLTTILPFAIIFKNNLNKEKSNATNLINYINIIIEILPNLMKKYENIFKNGNGESKQTLVLNEVSKYCIDNKIEYNEELTKKAIETLIDVSKNINKGK